MTQTNAALNFRKASVDISTDQSDWTELDNHGAAVAYSGGSRAVGSQHVFGDEDPIVLPGKKAAKEVTVRFLYTEEAAGPFEICRAIYEDDDSLCYLRWSPGRDDPGNFRFSTSTGTASVLAEFGYPGGEAGSGDPIPCEIKVVSSRIVKSTVP